MGISEFTTLESEVKLIILCKLFAVFEICFDVCYHLGYKSKENDDK